MSDAVFAMVEALLLAVDDQWRHNNRFSDTWQGFLESVMGLEEGEGHTLTRDDLHATLGSIAKACGVRQDTRWEQALQKNELAK